METDAVVWAGHRSCFAKREVDGMTVLPFSAAWRPPRFVPPSPAAGYRLPPSTCPRIRPLQLLSRSTKSLSGPSRHPLQLPPTQGLNSSL